MVISIKTLMVPCRSLGNQGQTALFLVRMVFACDDKHPTVSLMSDVTQTIRNDPPQFDEGSEVHLVWASWSTFSRWTRSNARANHEHQESGRAVMFSATAPSAPVYLFVFFWCCTLPRLPNCKTLNTRVGHGISEGLRLFYQRHLSPRLHRQHPQYDLCLVSSTMIPRSSVKEVAFDPSSPPTLPPYTHTAVVDTHSGGQGDCQFSKTHANLPF